MKTVSFHRQIDAPIDRVFDTVAHIENFAKAVPDIIDVEILNDVQNGVGARFRETRRMNGRDAATELTVTEYVPNERVRLVSDAGGAIWDSLFTLTPKSGGVFLVLEMSARPRTILARLTTPLLMGVVAKAVAKDMDAVKQFCEQGAETAAVS